MQGLLPDFALELTMAQELHSVLVVDDSVGVCTAVAMILEEDGYNVDMAHAYQQGLRSALDGNFKLVIIDIGLGRESGIALAEKILWGNVNCKIILMSGSPELPADFERQPELTRLPVLLKPFGRQALLDCIRKTLDEAAA